MPSPRTTTASGRQRRGGRGTRDRPATFAALHAVSLAAPVLRAGLTAEGAGRSVTYLRTLLGTPAVALTADRELLAWGGVGMRQHAHAVPGHAAEVLGSGSSRLIGPPRANCGSPACPIRYGVLAPLTVHQRVVGVLCAYAPNSPADLVRATGDVARWVSGQLELAEFDRDRARLAQVESRMLRAEISPHFVFNSLTAISSFMRFEPDQARDLLQDFADVARYSLGRHRGLATLDEELRAIDHYLRLERVRFADRLQVTLRVAGEVRSVTVPFLCLQSLVDNAIRHGIERKAGPGRITIRARQVGADALISVEDDGVGLAPDRVRRLRAGEDRDDRGLGSVDRMIRLAFGDRYGLSVETTPGVGTTVSVRVPVRSSGVSGHGGS
jgi:two-component system, LytTR family, sensor kinase